MSCTKSEILINNQFLPSVIGISFGLRYYPSTWVYAGLVLSQIEGGARGGMLSLRWKIRINVIKITSTAPRLYTGNITISNFFIKSNLVFILTWRMAGIGKSISIFLVGKVGGWAGCPAPGCGGGPRPRALLIQLEKPAATGTGRSVPGAGGAQAAVPVRLLSSFSFPPTRRASSNENNQVSYRRQKKNATHSDTI